MVAILVVLTIVLLLAIELFLEERRAERSKVVGPDRGSAAAKRPVSTDRSGRSSDDLLFHPGHTWARPLANGLVEVGADDFAAGFIGRVAAVLTPAPGAKLVQGEPAWTLVSVKGRRLPLASPITGEVVAVAPVSAETPAPPSPEKAPDAPPWTLLVRPAARQAGFANLFAGGLARAWRTVIREALVTRQAPLTGAVSPDGGRWHPQFGDMLDDGTWFDLRRENFPEPIETAAIEPASTGAPLGEEWR